MRTDVKVGLICLFVLALGVVCYFAFPGAPKDRGEAPASPAPALAPANPGGNGGSTDSGLLIAPPAPASSPAAAPALGALGPGGSILGPAPTYAGAASPSMSPPVATSPSGSVTITASGTGGRPLTVGGAASEPSFGALSGSPALGSSPVTSTHNPGPSSLITESPAATTSSGFGPDFTSSGSHTTDGVGPSAGLSGGMSSSFGSSGSEYTIIKGDTFGKIAKANHTTIKALESANPGISSNKLKIGQKIKLPSSTTGSPDLGSFGTKPETPPAATHSAHGSSTQPASALVGTTYTVKSGDTLHKIAKAAYGNESLWRLIWRANRQQLDDPDDLTPGMKLKIPTR